MKKVIQTTIIPIIFGSICINLDFVIIDMLQEQNNTLEMDVSFYLT